MLDSRTDDPILTSSSTGNWNYEHTRTVFLGFSYPQMYMNFGGRTLFSEEKLTGAQTISCAPKQISLVVEVRQHVIGKPLKTRCRHLWEEWMVEEVINYPTVACRPASRLQMSEWIHTSFNELKESNIGYNSWSRHSHQNLLTSKSVSLTRIST